MGAFIEVDEFARLQGQGRRTYPEGLVLEGIFGNGQLNQGTITFRDGTIEEGEFLFGQLQGQGRRTHPDGRVEEGVFAARRLKQGKIFDNNRTIAEGEFVGEELHNGQGRKIFLPDGPVLEGRF